MHVVLCMNVESLVLPQNWLLSCCSMFLLYCTSCQYELECCEKRSRSSWHSKAILSVRKRHFNGIMVKKVIVYSFYKKMHLHTS